MELQSRVRKRPAYLVTKCQQAPTTLHESGNAASGSSILACINLIILIILILIYYINYINYILNRKGSAGGKYSSSGKFVKRWMTVARILRVNGL